MEPSCWENSLDVDDSDLRSHAVLRPCKQQRRREKPDHTTSTSLPQTLDSSHSLSHSQTVDSSSQRSFRVIPGPAGIVQTAMLRKAHDNRNILSQEEPPMPTQEYIRRAVEDPEEDADFKRNPWLSAIEFVNGPIAHLGDIKQSLKNGKLDQVVAVIKSATPNGLGDLMVTLKDPMGTISGTIHHKVFTEGEFGKDISVGSVVILQKVSVFSPSRSAHYLNITVRNLVKVFHKDAEPSIKQNLHGCTIEDAATVSDSGGDTMISHRALSLERGAEGILNGIRSNGSAKRSYNFDGHQGEVNPFQYNGNRCSKRSNTDTNHTIDASKRILKEADTIEIGENEHRASKKDTWPIEVDNVLSSTKCASNLVDHEEEETDAIWKQMEPKMTTSLLQWTDEQLNELSAGDFEDDISLL